jgi:hypothetical protein
MNFEQIYSWAIVLAALTIAVIIAIKTPKKTWFTPAIRRTDSSHEWAPEYTLAEKLKLIGLQLVVLLPLVIAIKIMKSTHLNMSFLCKQTWGVSQGMWYFSGSILLLWLFFLGGCIYQWFYWLKVYRHEQFPVSGHKVWKPQKVLRGAAAKRRAKMMLGLSMVSGIGMSICLFLVFFLIQGLVTPEVLAAKCG